MKRSRRLIIALVAACLPVAAVAGDYYVYPAKGQDQQQQEKDTYECQQWATKQSGFDPTDLPQAPAQVPSDPSAGGRRVVRGAALGAVVGSMTTNVGTGAAWGAAAGVLGNARSRRKHAAQQEASDQQAAGQYAQQRTSYDSAYSACLGGRGYTLSPKP